MAFINKVQNASGPKIKLALALVILGFMAVMYFSFKTSMNVSTSDSSLTISYRSFVFAKTTYTVNFADVEQVVLYEKAPSMRKVFGSNMGSTRVGTYSTPDLGDFKAAVDDVNRPLLFIKTKDQGYMLSPADAAALKQTIESKKAK
ncbi:MAG TPA: PH domain-containing protein [Symbiobacteriaceae bacterium]|nr:PH domain-containing protein [Symbiobacteriaceae bacterium]